MTPKVVAKFLDNGWVSMGARVVLCLPFWLGGLVKLIDFNGGSAEMAGFGLAPGGVFNAISIIIQLGGAVLVMFVPPLAWLGAAVLALYTLVMIPIAHAFWTLTGGASGGLLLAAGDRLAIVGGLALAAILARRPNLNRYY